MSVTWIFSQVFTVIEYGLLGASYLAKNRKAVVTLDIASMACGIIAFILLGADLGMAMSVIILLANFYYLWDEHNHTAAERSKLHLRDYIVLVVVLAGIAVVTVLTYDGPLSLLSVAATVSYEISIWQKSTKVYKFLGIPVAGCWMLYNGFVNSPFGVLCELVMFITSIIGYTREIRSEKRKTQKIEHSTLTAKPKIPRAKQKSRKKSSKARKV